MLHTTRTDEVPSNPQARAGTDIMQYEKQLVEDLKQIPEEKQDDYVVHTTASSLPCWAVSHDVPVPMVTGANDEIASATTRALDAVTQNRFDEFHDWRNRFQGCHGKDERGSQRKNRSREEAWNRLNRDV